MGWLNNMNDVVLDDAAFEKAIADFSDLAVQLQSLRDDIVDLLDVLKKGFDTPAGRKFIRSCDYRIWNIEYHNSVLSGIKPRRQERKCSLIERSYFYVYNSYKCNCRKCESKR